jgi:hypothetical protein
VTTKRYCLTCGRERPYPEGWKKIYFDLKSRRHVVKCPVCLEAAQRHKKERL